jgi:hypothetical protein
MFAGVWSQKAGSRPDIGVGIEERMARVKDGGTEKPGLSREMARLSLNQENLKFR